jgi:hypothetical protein|nr:MAG TPA: hypothetical protein [Caudoviricetes sp.]
MNIITLHDHEEHYIDKSLELNYIVIRNVSTLTHRIEDIDRKIKLGQGFSTANRVIMNLLLDGRSIQIIYEKDTRIIYYEDRLYDVMKMDLELHFK